MADKTLTITLSDMDEQQCVSMESRDMSAEDLMTAIALSIAALATRLDMNHVALAAMIAAQVTINSTEDSMFLDLSNLTNDKGDAK